MSGPSAQDIDISGPWDPKKGADVPSSVTLFWDAHYGGDKLIIKEPDQVGPLPGAWGGGDHVIQVGQAKITFKYPGQASSLIIGGPTTHWLQLWETPFSEDDDVFWICPIPAGWSFGIKSFDPPNKASMVKLGYPRPHGNNSWNDLIKGVSWTALPPWGDPDNRTIIWPNGWQCGSGLWSRRWGIGDSWLNSDGTVIPH